LINLPIILLNEQLSSCGRAFLAVQLGQEVVNGGRLQSAFSRCLNQGLVGAYNVAQVLVRFDGVFLFEHDVIGGHRQTGRGDSDDVSSKAESQVIARGIAGQGAGDFLLT
jgi:hypothetical protein